MAKLSNFDVIVPISIEIEGLTVNMKVRKNFMTTNKQVALIEAELKDQTLQSLAQFCEFVTWWDIVDDDGAMVPLDPSVLSDTLPVNVLHEMMQASIQALRALGK